MQRFLDIELTRDHNITSGKVYNDAIQNERRGDYLGKTVQVFGCAPMCILWYPLALLRVVQGDDNANAGV